MNTYTYLSRRNFLRLTTLAVGTAPLYLRTYARGAQEKPSNRVTLGFIGMGKQNSYLLTEFIHRSQTQVVAVCDVDTNRRENAKRKVEEYYSRNSASGYKGCDTYTDFREVIDRKDIDAVVIATPDHWHALIAIAAANAGKDIYCEKPLRET